MLSKGIPVVPADDHFFAVLPESGSVAVGILPVVCRDAGPEEDAPDIVVDAEGRLRAARVLGHSVHAESQEETGSLWAALPLDMLTGPHTPRILTGRVKQEDADRILSLQVRTEKTQSIEGEPHIKVSALTSGTERQLAAREPEFRAQYRGEAGTVLTVFAQSAQSARIAARMLEDAPPVPVQFADGFHRIQCSPEGMPFGSFDDPAQALWTEQSGRPLSVLHGHLPPAQAPFAPQEALCVLADDITKDPEQAWARVLSLAAFNPGMSLHTAAMICPVADCRQRYRTERGWEAKGIAVQPWARGALGVTPAVSFDGRLTMRKETFYGLAETDAVPDLPDPGSFYRAYGVQTGSHDELETAVSKTLYCLRSCAGEARLHRNLAEPAAACEVLYAAGIAPVRPLKALCAASAAPRINGSTEILSALPAVMDQAAGLRQMMEQLQETALTCQSRGQDITVPKLAKWLAENARAHAAQRTVQARAPARKKQMERS